MAGSQADDEPLRRLEEATRDAHRLQLETLRTILRRNAGCGYLRPHLAPLGGPADGGAAAAVDAESFRRLVPVSSYEDYADHIQRMADGTGDPSFLSFDRLVCFFYSSGTSSTKPKMIPFFDSQPAKVASGLAHQASSALLRRTMPPRPTINKILWFIYAGNVRETSSGLKAMAASAYPFHSGGPNPAPAPPPVFSMCISPPQVILGTDTQQQTYCHLLCGLSSRHAIDAIRAPYAAGLVRAIRLLESKWQQLCDDIEHGTVAAAEVTDPAMRTAVQGLLGRPWPEEAGRIRQICGSRARWGGILGDLWAEARYVACVTTGTMEQYYHHLEHYAGSRLPVLCGDYFASECAVGVNMERKQPPAETSFVVVPTAAYFEFLPFEIGSAARSRADLVDISGVEVGKMYEVVATTHRGLYRYRLGDVVRVVGFHNASPKVEFVTRAPKDHSEEVFTEKDLADAVGSLQAVLGEINGGRMGDQIVEYASFLDSESKHAVIFLEMEKVWVPPDGGGDLASRDLKRACSILEISLGSVYKVKREGGDLGAMEIVIVEPGSFDDLTRMAVQINGAPANQYKPPKILRNSGFVELLQAHAVLSMRLSSDEEH